MDWVQFCTFLIANIVFILTLWLWNRSESRSDNREILSLMKSIQDEIKDFHGRLCAIEERKIKIFEK
jgi:hypothetical protein